MWNIKFLPRILGLLVLLQACSPKISVITAWQSDKIALDQSLDSHADSAYLAYLKPLKENIDRKMGEVIGISSQRMRVQRPESILSNLVSDIYFQKASEFVDGGVDLAIVNLGGIRSELREGEITLGKIYELMPFENELVVLWLRGHQLLELFDFFASVGGQGISGARMEIREGKAVNVLINSVPVEFEKLYAVATNDYLAAGNDGMVQLAMAEKMLTTGLKVRDMLMEFVKAEHAAGRLIQSKLDGRIRMYSE